MIRVLTFALTLALLLTGSTVDVPAQSEATPIKIGYAISRTGPFAPGAQVTQEPNYLLWAEQVNAAGGLSVKGQKRKIELISSDDRSDVETIVRTYEKLMTVDKVDLILPPWGSTANFAVAPLANKNGYPVLAPTALSMKLVDMKLPYFFSMLPQPYVLMQAAADMLAAKGVKTVAVIYMDDLFGLENIAAFETAVKAKGIEIVDKKSYPLGVKDLSPVLRAIKEKNPGAFVGLTYPPDTILASKQAKEISFNPRVLHRGRYRLPALQERDGRRLRRGVGHRLVEREDEPGRARLLRRAREEVPEGARPLGERPLLGRPADPPGGHREGRRRPQGDPRVHRGGRARYDPRPAALQGLGGAVPRHRQPVDRRRLRGGVAGRPRDRADARAEARVEITR